MDRPALDRDDHLLSFGPLFGAEDANEYLRRLRALGLCYPDDVWVLEELTPDWCELYIGVAVGAR